MASNGGNVSARPYVQIIEQPAKCAIRFRYECEGRSAGSIPGVNSTADNKSFPAIQVCGYRGKAVVVVSCITKDAPYRTHPHNLVGKEGCKRGVCTIQIDNTPDMICSFSSLGIQCVKRKDIEESLKQRETIKVDPFRAGFAHRSQASTIDLNVVRLCFQVFLEAPNGKFQLSLPPVISDPIYDKKAMAELIITKMSHSSAPCTGGKEIILLCDRVAKDDIQVRFYHESQEQGLLIWEGYGEFNANDVHKQVAICLRTPKYFDENIVQPVIVQIQLRRPSDGCTSMSKSFQITQRELDPDGVVRKRHKRLKEENYDLLQKYISIGTSDGPSSEKRSYSFGAGMVKPGTSSDSQRDMVNFLKQHIGAIPSTSPGNRTSPQFNVAPPPFGSLSPGSLAPSNMNDNTSDSYSNKSSPQHHQQYVVMGGNGQQAGNQPAFMHSDSGEFGAPQQQQQPMQRQNAGSPSAYPQQAYTSIPPPNDPNNLAFTLGRQQTATIPSPNPYHYQQSSPNPSVGTYSSAPSPTVYPVGNNNINNNNNNNDPQQQQQPSGSRSTHHELANEVVERFDSLDIDSSELIQNLDFNSTTMLDLMMDTSSGLSISDSFSDITNGQRQGMIPAVINNQVLTSSMTSSMGQSADSGNQAGQRYKLKLQTNGMNHRANIETQSSLETPTIEMSSNFSACGFVAQDGSNPNVIKLEPMLSGLDIESNNIQ